MLFRRVSFIALSWSLAAVIPLAAQPQSPTPKRPGTHLRAPILDPATVVARACGVVTHGDEVIGTGPDYSARFGTRGFAFEPARSSRGAPNPTLRFRIQSYARGSGDAVAAGAAAPTHDGRTVRYTRVGFTETYELRPEGVKQSCVFAQLPSGSGDLVVRARIETALPLARADSAGLLFEEPGSGGVRIGAVTGIDARGESVQGRLRYRAGVVEMALPASFVDAARLPLVVDPLFGSATPIPLSPRVSRQLDVAYLASADCYLVVWDTRLGPPFSVPFSVVWGQLVGSDASMRGPLFSVFPAFCDAERPSVESTPLGFVVAASAVPLCGSTSPYYSAVSPSGTVTRTWTTGPPLQDAEMGHTVSDVRVASQDGRVVRFTAPAQGIGAPSVSVALSSSITPDSQVAMARSGGSTVSTPGRFLVVWERKVRGGFKIPGGIDIWGAIVDESGNIIAAEFPIATTAADEESPSVDGDGTSWVVAYQREVGPGTGSHDIYCRGVFYDQRMGVVRLATTAVQVQGSNRDEFDPVVAWTGESYLIGYTSWFGAKDTDVWVNSLEAFDCRACEGRFPVARSRRLESGLRIVSQRASSPTGEGAMLIWKDGNGGVSARVFRAEDGRVANLLGGCGSGGWASATCGRIGVSKFGIRVEDAARLAPSWMMLGFARVNFPCGACTLIPNPAAAVPRLTDQHGRATVTLGVPNDPTAIGLKVLFQWVTVSSAGACGSGLDLSNGIEVEIQ